MENISQGHHLRGVWTEELHSFDFRVIFVFSAEAQVIRDLAAVDHAVPSVPAQSYKYPERPNRLYVCSVYTLLAVDMALAMLKTDVVSQQSIPVNAEKLRWTIFSRLYALYVPMMARVRTVGLARITPSSISAVLSVR